MALPTAIEVDHASPQSQPPPTFCPIINEINISAEKESRIIGVTIYPTQAEVTREVTFRVATGQNKVVVSDLSSYLDPSSLRIEGKGAGTIQGVSVFTMRRPPVLTTSPAIESINERRTAAELAIARHKLNRDAVCKYLETMSVQHVGAENLGGILQASEENLMNLDSKMEGLKKDLNMLEQLLKEEKKRLNPTINSRLQKQVEVGIFADRESEVVLVLKYAMNEATWGATYDARISTQTKDSPVKLIYQARITQYTGEDWTDIPILLETNTPTFNVRLPLLSVQQLNVKTKRKESARDDFLEPYPPPAPLMIIPPHPAGDQATSLEVDSEDFLSHIGAANDELRPDMFNPIASVHREGAMGATFRIPGLVTVPSDNQAHNITIAEVKLDATLYWISVPKEDRRIHLQAKVKNTSEYVLLDGSVNIYVDGAFISRSTISNANPQESLTFSLGIDPAIRLTYHPVIQKSSQSGLINKTISTISTQHITVQNTKLTPIGELKVVVGIPVSNDTRITVKLKNPNLSLPLSVNNTQRGSANINTGMGGGGRGSSKDNERRLVPAPIKVSDKPLIHAQWHGADDEKVRVDALGHDGRINWVISELGSMETVNLALSWEVIAVEGLEIDTVYHSG